MESMKDTAAIGEPEGVAAESGQPEEPSFDFIMELVGVGANDSEKMAQYRDGLEKEISSRLAKLDSGDRVWGWDKNKGWTGDWRILAKTQDGQVMIERFVEGGSGDGMEKVKETAVIPEDDLRLRNYLFNLVNARLGAQEGNPSVEMNDMIEQATMKNAANLAVKVLNDKKSGGGLE
ncbi:MAG: hypothetical protein AAB867_00110 [Patescibacteria group bacterium]